MKKKLHKMKSITSIIILFALPSLVNAQWQLFGNNVTSSDFLGTLNNRALVFRVATQKAGRIDFANNIANTSIGFQTLNLLNSGSRNASFGFQALKLNTGSDNSALGYRALFNNTTGFFNTASGANALYSNTAGYQNTANGYNSLFSNLTSVANTATGFSSLYLNTAGYQNVANGWQALYSNDSGYQNTATGANALFSNTKGWKNTADGFEALYSNTVGVGNTATGYQSLRSNVIGIDNTATGYAALASNIADNNTAHGYAALSSNTTGTNNTASGMQVLYSNLTGINNTGTGFRALRYNTAGKNNTANGWQTLYFTTGDNNTAVGYNALFYNTTGFNNTALGYSAGISFNSTADNTTTLGANAFINMSSGTNATAIGAGAIATASNTMQLGSANTTVFINNGVMVISDGRFKDDVNESDAPGLDFINKLRPVCYKLNYKRFDDFLRNGIDASNKKTDAAYQQKLIEKGKQREVGFIAQEVEKTVKDNGYMFNGVYAPQNSNDHYGLDYSRFVVPLVKAVQELSNENETLIVQLAAINARLDALENTAGSSAQSNSQINKNFDSYLYQITPNPFSQKATISYKLPPYASNAQLLILDAAGKTIKTYSLSSGLTHQDVYANNLAAGIYHYSLLVNGKVIDSKKMVITK